ncbi:response regulator transcription factor [Sphingomonas lacunae]|uniref:Response regulator transcription factor n=1 Tax=Sphingomonas lacunae TaxID=2698828 RepID=A0A6M4ATY8_9SPHN|nr:response regulator transcription factor [Sphingomonas lacunae]QJQ32577.1 response regulator transcription factor [Sphingomonas lacunae]
MQILLVEDDDKVGAFIAGGLRQEGHVVTHCVDGRAGLVTASSESFDLIILDRMLPAIDGMRIMQAIRATADPTPILMLSALGDVDERVRGLEAGADDYLAKPFAMSELLARVAALGRRKPALPAVNADFRIADLVIDRLGQSVRRGGRRIDLTPREYRILTILADNSGRVVTRAMLLEKVWDYSFDPQTNIIDQHISKLRQKIDADADAPLIHTVRGSGYVMRLS